VHNARNQVIDVYRIVHLGLQAVHTSKQPKDNLHARIREKKALIGKENGSIMVLEWFWEWFYPGLTRELTAQSSRALHLETSHAIS
jgi:hypothetical protein